MRRIKIRSSVSVLIFLGLLSLLSVPLLASTPQKYSSRTYKSSKSNSTKSRATPIQITSPDESDGAILSSRSLPTSDRLRDISANDFDQTGGESVDSPSSWATSGGNGGYREPKSTYNSAPLPSVAPRYSSADSKYSHQGSSGQSGLGVYSSSSNSYPYGAYSNPQSYYANPLLDAYPYYEKERAARELPYRPVSTPYTMAAAASSLFGGVSSPEFGRDSFEDNLALGGHHHDHHHHGWGWKGHKEHVKHVVVEKYDNNAIGLLGLLGVLTLLSNVLLLLTTTTTTTAAARRRKRSTDYSMTESEDSKRQRIFLDVLPILAPVAHARNGQMPLDCTLQGICLTNKLLVTEYGYQGRSAGDRITSAIFELFQDETGDKNKIVQAGRKGRNQRDCVKIYPKCRALQQTGPNQLPFVIGINDVPKLLARVRHVAASAPLQL